MELNEKRRLIVTTRRSKISFRSKTGLVISRKELKLFFQRAVQAAAAPLCWAVNRDRITFTKIHPRDDLKRIGTAYGGWFIPARLFDASAVCYCAGCGEDISFGLGVIRAFGCHVHGFDPTPRSIAHVRKRTDRKAKYHFHAVGLWDEEDTLKFFAPRKSEHVSHSILNLQQTEDYFRARVRRLSEVMKEEGHHQLDLLKLDIEGAEYKVVQSIFEDDIDVRVLCVEYDEYTHPLNADYRKRIGESVGHIIERGYALVYARNGNYTFVREA